MKILYFAAKNSEVGVDSALMVLINENHEISKDAVMRIMESNAPIAGPDDVHIPAIDLTSYDKLLEKVSV